MQAAENKTLSWLSRLLNCHLTDCTEHSCGVGQQEVQRFEQGLIYCLLSPLCQLTLACCHGGWNRGSTLHTAPDRVHGEGLEVHEEQAEGEDNRHLSLTLVPILIP
jgi:hypothetical protein